MRYVAGHIGDGVIVYGNDHQVDVLSEHERGEFANTTFFVTSKDADSSFRVYSGHLRAPSGFIIMSDGAAESLYIRKSKTPNATYCRQILQWGNRYSQKKIHEAILMNLEQGVFKLVTNDDCSLAMLKIT